MRITFEHGDLCVRLTTDVSSIVQISDSKNCIVLGNDEIELVRDILNTIIEITGGDNK